MSVYNIHHMATIPLRAGIAQVEITPTPGISLTGYIAREGVSSGIHDPLTATALVLSGGGQSAALVNCDLLGLDLVTAASIRRRIQAATGIPAANVMLACTHTHSGPATIFLQDCGDVDKAYLDELEHQVVDAVRGAISDLQPVQAAGGIGELHGWTLDRRSPEGEIDADLGVISLRRLQGQPLAVLANYVCHPVVLGAENRLISADYPGFLKRTLQGELSCPSIFLTGASGNIDPVHRGSFQAAQAFGQALAQEILRVLARLENSTPTEISISSENLPLPLLPAPAPDALRESIASYKQMSEKFMHEGRLLEAKIEQAMLTWAEATLAKVQNGLAEASTSCEVQVLRFGQNALVGVAGELFSGLGQAIKAGGYRQNHAAQQERTILISAYTNGDAGYIPTREAYASGGYEINEAYRFYGYPAALAPEAGEKIVETALNLLE